MERKEFIEKLNDPWKKFVLCICWGFLDQARDVAKAAFLCVIEASLFNGTKTKKLLAIEEKFSDVVCLITDEEILESFKTFMNCVFGDGNIVFANHEMEWVSRYIKSEEIRKEIEWIIWQYMKDAMGNPNVKKEMEKVQWITTKEERGKGELLLERMRQMPRNNLTNKLYWDKKYEEALIVLFEDGGVRWAYEIVGEEFPEMETIIKDAFKTYDESGLKY